MTKRALFLFAGLLLICGVVFPQVPPTYQNFATFKNDFNVVKLIKGENEAYTGSPYLLKEFKDANISTTEGKGYKEIPMNYNIYTDKFEFLLDEQPYSLEHIENIAYIELDGQNFLWKEYSYSSANSAGYLERLCTGEYSLYKKYRVVYTKPIATTGYKEAKIADFSTRRPDYFIKSGESKIHHISSFDDIPIPDPSKSAEIEGYIKKSKLNFKKEENLISLVNYLNTL